MPPAVEEWTLNHRTTREVPRVFVFEMTDPFFTLLSLLLNPSIVCQFSYCMFQLCGFYLTVSYIFHLFVEVLTVFIHPEFSDHFYDHYFELFIS